jgi:hypothetical protein
MSTVTAMRFAIFYYILLLLLLFVALNGMKLIGKRTLFIGGGERKIKIYCYGDRISGDVKR